MDGEHNYRSKSELDPVVDLTIPSLGIFILTLLGYQLFSVLMRYFPTIQVGWLTFMGGLGSLVAIVIRKALKGEFDLPKSIKIAELGILLGVTLGLVYSAPWIPRILSLVFVFILHSYGVTLAEISEELSYDFHDRENRSNWKSGWQTEGDRLYDKHIIGFKHLKGLIIQTDILLVLCWIIGQKVNLMVVGSGMLILFLQIVILGAGFYQKKRVYWKISNYQIQPQIFKQMIGSILILALLLSCIAFVLPTNYNPIPWSWIGQRLTDLFSGFNYQSGDWLEDNSAEEERPFLEQSGQGREEPVMEITQSWHNVLYVILLCIVGGAILVVILGFILSNLSDEFYRLNGFSRLLIAIFNFFKNLLTAWLNFLRRGFSTIRVKVENYREERKRERAQELIHNLAENDLESWTPKNSREEIVMFFLKIVQVFDQQGLTKGSHQTLTEYLRAGLARFPELREELVMIQRLVEEALYSNHSVDEKQVQEMEKVSDKILHVIN